MKIDPGLAAALAGKDPAARVQVLVIYGNDNRLPADVLSGLDQASPDKRRQQTLAALKKRMRATSNGAIAVLSNPAFSGEVGNLRELYLAGALSFEATNGVVNALHALPDDATMYHDNLEASHDASQAPAPDGGKMLPAAVDTAWGVKWVNAHKVWSQLGFDGTGVIVGHIDTGVWLAHPDLAGGIYINPGEIAGNGIDDDGNGFIDDYRGWDFGDNDNNPDDTSPTGGHGTHTAGTVIGDGTGTVLTGVAPGAKLIPIKLWNAAGSGGTLGMVWAAEQYCIEMGARVITMSLGFSGAISPAFMRAERDNCANLRDAGVLLCNSAGNDHATYEPPIELGLTARVPAPWNPLAVPYSSTGGVLSVGGTSYKTNGVYASSSWGPAKWNDVDPYNDWPYAPGVGLTKPDIAAPGVGVNSTVVGGGYSGNTWTGTSMSCPHVAGVAALMLQKNPSLSPAGLDSLMEQTALGLGVAGKDNVFGSGLVNALAAVQAVPVAQRPDISWTAVLPDAGADHVLDPGQVSPIAFELRNASHVVTATTVTAGLTVVANPWVTVVDGTATFPSLAVNDGLGDNLADTFSLDVAAGAPQGYVFTMLLTVTADGGFQRTFDIEWYVGLPAFRTHDLGGIALTVTDQGIIGYMSDAGVEGEGMSYQSGAGGLFLGSFWAGTDATYVCARDFSGTTPETFEWVVSSAPNGRVKDLGTTGSDQTFQSVFSDAGHAAPKPLKVEQTSMTFAMPNNDRFVVLEYRMTNNGATALPALYNAVFCDFDINDSAANFGHTDAARKLTYVQHRGPVLRHRAARQHADDEHAADQQHDLRVSAEHHRQRQPEPPHARHAGRDDGAHGRRLVGGHGERGEPARQRRPGDRGLRPGLRRHAGRTGAGCRCGECAVLAGRAGDGRRAGEGAAPGAEPPEPVQPEHDHRVHGGARRARAARGLRHGRSPRPHAGERAPVVRLAPRDLGRTGRRRQPGGVGDLLLPHDGGGRNLFAQDDAGEIALVN
ncbi:MAG: S8 family serine peptidase [bacterium]|nr:S8 family serine peptidase [bacterium]